MSDGGSLPDANFYKITSGVSTLMQSGITISNGIAWSADNTLMYYIDTPTGKVDVFNFNTLAGTICNCFMFS
jgi:sugar lactone lactonase YvrE